jgi:hypothetical protein
MASANLVLGDMMNWSWLNVMTAFGAEDRVGQFSILLVKRMFMSRRCRSTVTKLTRKNNEGIKMLDL